MHTFNDIAIPISWPDKTAWGDEKWMAFLKRIGLIKNLHFKVGHAALLLIERHTGNIHYFDFGRYLSPRGYGRARSATFDPRLEISTKAQITPQGELQNLEEILLELCAKENATHGGGRTVFAICKQISFSKCLAYAEKLVAEGPILYGALAKNNNSCSRFVAQVLTEGMDIDDKRRKKILYPECIKASPTSNVVNATPNNEVLCYEGGIIQQWKMKRKDSLLFQFGLLKDNFTQKDPQEKHADHSPGMIDIPARPSQVPAHAQWIGGIGEGAWFQLEQLPDKDTFVIYKYSAEGKLEYTIHTQCVQSFDIGQPYTFTANFLHKSYSILQHSNLYLFSAESTLNKTNNNQQNIKAIL